MLSKGRSRASFVLKLSIAAAYALVPLSLALRLPEPASADGWSLAMGFVAKTFFLVSVGIFTFEILRLRRFPDHSAAIAPLATILLTPAIVVVAHALVFSVPADRMLREMAAFYLAQYIGVMVVLAIFRFAVERTVRGWGWVPTMLSLVCLFVPAVVALGVFIRVLWLGDVWGSWPSAVALFVGLVTAVASEVRMVLKVESSPTNGSKLGLF